MESQTPEMVRPAIYRLPQLPPRRWVHFYDLITLCESVVKDPNQSTAKQVMWLLLRRQTKTSHGVPCFFLKTGRLEKRLLLPIDHDDGPFFVPAAIAIRAIKELNRRTIYGKGGERRRLAS